MHIRVRVRVRDDGRPCRNEVTKPNFYREWDKLAQGAGHDRQIKIPLNLTPRTSPKKKNVSNCVVEGSFSELTDFARKTLLRE
ncbi:hypothetical protein TcasGA2_TC032926 [Tribolium castaneum]|uniref:Uncharacterized protein n=1 Tax=Tribolium castaneum TaxID=7070 RepID=A0A139WJG6_TRICA|nr:hypothetical protein TcasGA2_TC032926 [Tribolium castaneum]